MKRILGLDLGTNSIGWAYLVFDDNGNLIEKIRLGSRIIPMSQDVMGKFESGISVSQTAERTHYRSTRHLRERSLQRRERLFRVLHMMGFLPQHFDQSIGWDKNDNKTYGKFLDESEPKLAWKRNKDGKMEFLFMDSFHEMIADFMAHDSSWTPDQKVPLDWTIYYLRSKALRAPISKEELAWIILNFNQKRGYYQLRGEEEEEDKTKRVEFLEARVVRVEATDRKKGKSTWYNVYFDNGMIDRRTSAISLENWVGQTRQFIVTTEYEADGVTLKLDKEGNVKRSFRIPKDDDWTLRKKRTEHDIEESGLHVGTFIYQALRDRPKVKIRGNFVHTIERKFYKQELRAILTKQTEFIPELQDQALLQDCIANLYPSNEAQRQKLQSKDFIYLLVNDIIFYHRPFKSQKSLISNCSLEKRISIDRSTEECIDRPIKCIARSNPYYQEFRLWQFITNIRLFDRDSQEDVTSRYLSTSEEWERLYAFLYNRKEINQDTLFKEFFGWKKPKGRNSVYPIHWNYAEDKEKTYPCNETRATLLTTFEKAEMNTAELNTREGEMQWWHLLYSVTDKLELEQALRKRGLSQEQIRVFTRIKPFEKDYGAFSEKAIKRFLTLLRKGSFWNADAIDTTTRARIDNIIAGNIDEKLRDKMQHKSYPLQKLEDFQGLPVWLASYIIYGHHSEVSEIVRWETPQDLQNYIHNFKQHSLRNPIVEQVVLETLRTVYDIWKKFGDIDEIHLEMGREMKKTAKQRQDDSQHIQRNENTKLRIKALLMELKNDVTISDVRPYSPSQQDILRIYEEGALATLEKSDQDYDEIIKISQKSQPSASEMKRYKLWLEQKYQSPYTGRFISLTKLFTPAYEIEHVIPQKRFFDDSFSNKVICEAEINKAKSSMLAHEFITKRGGEIIHSQSLGDLRVLKVDDYESLVKHIYKDNATKRRKLLLDDIPTEFIQRQLNDSRYIARFIQSVLSNLVREEGEEEAKSKHVIVCTGGITNRLKKDWGLQDVWNHLVSPRYQRLNELTNSEDFGHWENKDGKRVFQTSMPIELQKGYSKKRIDHRHHAMDALVIACASHNIINYLNNENAASPHSREDLRNHLCDKGRTLRKPWKPFTQDAEPALQGVVVSFKNYVRIINKATNFYQHYEQGKKKYIPQKGERLWAVRKPMHKETVFGRVNLRYTLMVSLAYALERPQDIVDKALREYILRLIEQHFDTKQLKKHFKTLGNKFENRDISKVEIWVMSDDRKSLVASRKPLNESFDKDSIAKITDTGIQKILLNFLKYKGDDPKVAFSPEGIIELNANIAKFNDGKSHQPIKKVRIFELLGNKYPVGQRGNRKTKFVEAQSGTNLYFAIFEDGEGKRSYETIQLIEVVERLKQGLSPVPDSNDKNISLKFFLSPNDLVYVPNEEEIGSNMKVEDLQRERIYKFIDSSNTTANFIPHRIATALLDVKTPINNIQNELGLGSPQSKHQRALTGEIIKSVCWKLEVDRLGNITKIIR